jgi:hypothetical protein
LTRDAAAGAQNTTHVATIANPDPSDGRASNPASQTDPLGIGPHIPALDLTANGGWTLEGYFSTTSTARQFIATNNPSGSGANGTWDLEMTFNPATPALVGQLSLRVKAADGDIRTDTTGLTLDDGEFHHWAVTWDPDNTLVSIFVDGTSEAAATVPIQAATASSRLFAIGGFPLSSTTFSSTLRIDGELDELRLSTGVLTPGQFLNAVVPAPAALPAGLAVLAMIAMRRRS